MSVVASIRRFQSVSVMGGLAKGRTSSVALGCSIWCFGRLKDDAVASC